MEKCRHGVLVGYAGKPYEHRLPDDIAADIVMLLHLVNAFSTDKGHVTAEFKYNGMNPDYLKITRRAGI